MAWLLASDFAYIGIVFQLPAYSSRGLGTFLK